MPIVQVLLFEGRTIAQKRKLVKSLTVAVVDSLGVKSDAVTIVITEIPKHNYAKAGILRSDKKQLARAR